MATPTLSESTFPRGPDPSEPGPPPRSGAIGWLRWAWRQLTGMRTALLLLLLLAVAAVPGSVFPQRRIDPGQVQGYLAEHRSTGPWLDRLGFFDVYSSPWFSAIYLLLFVSLIGCVVPRTRRHLRAMRAAPPRTPRRLERLPEHVVGTVDLDPQTALAAARTALRRRRYRVGDQRTDAAGHSLAAERGYLAETGNLLFHLALLAVLVCIAVGSFVGYSGQAVIVEGESFADTLPDYDSFDGGRAVDAADLPPFSFTLDSLAVGYEEQGSQRGAPRSFDAALSVRDAPDAAPRSVHLQVNEPLDVRGTRVFLVGNGYAPVLRITDGEGRVAFRGAVPFLPQDGAFTSLGVVKVPDARPRQLGLTGFLLPTAVTDPGGVPISIFPAPDRPRLGLMVYVSRPGEDGLRMNDGVPQAVQHLDVSGLTRVLGPNGAPLRLLLAPGQTATLPDGAGTVTFEGLKRFAALDIRYDPTKVAVLIAAVAALVGLTLSLFVRRRRLWIRVRTEADGTTVVEVAGLARGDDAGLAAEVRAVWEAAGSSRRPITQGA